MQTFVYLRRKAIRDYDDPSLSAIGRKRKILFQLTTMMTDDPMPPPHLFRTKDGKFVAVGALEPQFYTALLQVRQAVYRARLKLLTT